MTRPTARLILTGIAVALVAGVEWELYSGVAIGKSDGSSYRNIDSGLYWFKWGYHALITAFVAWAAYRSWRTR